MPIPIFRIPILVTKVIIHQMKDVEVVIVSLCSKRAERVVNICNKNLKYFDLKRKETKNLDDWRRLKCYLLAEKRCDKKDIPKRQLKISISNVVSFEVRKFNDFSYRHPNYLPEFTFSIDCLSNLQGQVIDKNVIIGDHFVPVVVQKNGRLMRNRKVYTHWSNVQLGLMASLEHFGSGMVIEKLELKGKAGFPKNFILKNFISNLISRQATVNNIDISDISEAEFKYILEDLKVKETFSASTTTCPDFEFSGMFHAQEVTISDAKWFKMEHLLKFNRKKLNIWGGEFKEQEINQFLELWRSGRFPRLEELKLTLNEPPNRWDFTGFEPPMYPMFQTDRRKQVVHWDGVIGNRKATASITTFLNSDSMDMMVDYDGVGYDSEDDGEEEPMDQEDLIEGRGDDGDEDDESIIFQ